MGQERDSGQKPHLLEGCLLPTRNKFPGRPGYLLKVCGTLPAEYGCEGGGLLRRQLIEIDPTHPEPGHKRPRQPTERTTLMMTIGLYVAWACVAMILLMAARDYRVD